MTGRPPRRWPVAVVVPALATAALATVALVVLTGAAGPSTRRPGRPSPEGSAPSTAAPSTAAPSTAAPSTAAPSTAAQPAASPTAAARPRGWTVTGLGDSVTANSGCDCSDFLHRYATLAERRTGIPVTVQNLGVPGQTSADLVASLDSDGTARAVAGSDLVVITIGANDLSDELADWQLGRCPLACFEQQMPAVTDNITAAVREVRRLRAGRPTEILVTDYWNVFVDGDAAAAMGAAYHRLSDLVTRSANTAICTGAGRAAASCVDLYGPFKGTGADDPTGLLADDGDHPNAAGDQAIATALAAHGWRELGLPGAPVNR